LGVDAWCALIHVSMIKARPKARHDIISLS
jgi:hypothetical protein